MQDTYRVLHNTLLFLFSESFMWLCLVAVGYDLSRLLSQLVFMAPPVSLELHERIVAWHYELHLSIGDIVHLSNHCDKTVHNVLKFYWDYDAFTCPFTQPQGCKHLLDQDDLNYLEAVLCAEPGLFLDELQDKLHTVRDIEVSIATISWTLNHIAITHKSISKEAAEWNEHLHATWQIAMAQYDHQQLVFVHEAGVDDQTNLVRLGGKETTSEARS